MARQFLVVVVVVVALALGCSDDGGGGGDGGAAGSGNAGGTQPSGGQASGGTTAGSNTAGGGNHTGGAGGSSAGGSSAGGSSGDARLGAASLNILAPSGCSVEAHYEDMPLVDGGHPVTATEKNKTIADGANDTDGARAHVACNWMGTAPPYDFTVGLSMDGQNSRALSLRGKAAAGQTLQTNVVLSLPGDKPYMGMCTVSTIAADETNHSVWGSLHCDSVSGAGGDVCGVGDSYFYFENCGAP